MRKTRITSEYRDSDYHSKLSPEDKAWLRRFETEYYGCPSNGQLSIHTPKQATALRGTNYDRQNDLSLMVVKEDGYCTRLVSVSTEACDFATTYDDPESILIAKETVTLKIKKRIQKKATQK